MELTSCWKGRRKLEFIAFDQLDQLPAGERAADRAGVRGHPTAKGSRRGKAPEPFALTASASFPRGSTSAAHREAPSGLRDAPTGPRVLAALGERGERRRGARGMTRCSDLRRFRLYDRLPGTAEKLASAEALSEFNHARRKAEDAGKGNRIRCRGSHAPSVPLLRRRSSRRTRSGERSESHQPNAPKGSQRDRVLETAAKYAGFDVRAALAPERLRRRGRAKTGVTYGSGRDAGSRMSGRPVTTVRRPPTW